MFQKEWFKPRGKQQVQVFHLSLLLLFSAFTRAMFEQSLRIVPTTAPFEIDPNRPFYRRSCYATKRKNQETPKDNREILAKAFIQHVEKTQDPKT